MTVTLTGTGCGAPETMTAEVQQALEAKITVKIF